MFGPIPTFDPLLPPPPGALLPLNDRNIRSTMDNNGGMPDIGTAEQPTNFDTMNRAAL